jgi:hypothetical protein
LLDWVASFGLIEAVGGVSDGLCKRGCG